MRTGAEVPPSRVPRSRVVDELAGVVRMRLPPSLSSSLSSLESSTLTGAVGVTSHLEHPGWSVHLKGRLQRSHLPGGAGAASVVVVGYTLWM